jgi:capsular exopolysaccharide synthesis family protein
MTKIAKALEKYKKEHNLTSTQIFNLEDTRRAEETRPSRRLTRSFMPVELLKEPPNPIEQAALKIKPAPDEEKTAAPVEINETFDLTAAGPTEPSKAVTPTNRFSSDLIAIVNPHCVEAGIFKVLRGKILFPANGKPPKSILITSAAPGEGKSFTASNLAANLAQNIENHVLLVDCDIRRPSIHKVFGYGMVDGLAEHLLNGKKLSSLLLKTGIDKLTVLPSGKPPTNPSELLSSGKMSTLIEELKNRYNDRFLIIDSPPPMLAPETTAMAKHVDGIIIVIQYGSTPLHLVEELIDNLGREKILGAVINRFDSRVSARYYGYEKYGKYYRKH